MIELIPALAVQKVKVKEYKGYYGDHWGWRGYKKKTFNKKEKKKEKSLEDYLSKNSESNLCPEINVIFYKDEKMFWFDPRGVTTPYAINYVMNILTFMKTENKNYGRVSIKNGTLMIKAFDAFNFNKIDLRRIRFGAEWYKVEGTKVIPVPPKVVKDKSAIIFMQRINNVYMFWARHINNKKDTFKRAITLYNYLYNSDECQGYLDAWSTQATTKICLTPSSFEDARKFNKSNLYVIKNGVIKLLKKYEGGEEDDYTTLNDPIYGT